MSITWHNLLSKTRRLTIWLGLIYRNFEPKHKWLSILKSWLYYFPLPTCERRTSTGHSCKAAPPVEIRGWFVLGKIFIVVRSGSSASKTLIVVATSILWYDWCGKSVSRKKDRRILKAARASCYRPTWWPGRECSRVCAARASWRCYLFPRLNLSHQVGLNTRSRHCRRNGFVTQWISLIFIN